MGSSQDAVPFPYIKATQYEALKARHKCLSRLPSPLIFMWRLFRWQHKWLNAGKILSESNSAVESLAMNSFQAAYFKYVTN